MTNYNALSVKRVEDRRSRQAKAPSYEDGWYNGNPLVMIKRNTYKKWRHKLIGKVRQVDLDQFDALDNQTNGKTKPTENGKAKKPETDLKKIRKNREKARAKTRDSQIKAKEERKKARASSAKEAIEQ